MRMTRLTVELPEELQRKLRERAAEVLAVIRSADGTLTGVAPEGAASSGFESFIHVEVDRSSDAAAMDALAADVLRVLGDVRASVTDWKPMQAKAREIARAIEKDPPPLAADQLADGAAFLDWLADNHFTFLAYRCHDLVKKDGEDALQIVPGSGLGFLREAPGRDIAGSFAALPPEVRAYARRPELLI